MSTAEKGFIILGGDLPSTPVKHFFLLDQVGLVYLFLIGLDFVGVLFCLLVCGFFSPCSVILVGHVHLF